MSSEQEVFKFPIEVIDIIQGLDHPDRRRILEVIINSGKGGLTKKEIVQKTGYTSDIVNIHLNHMSMYGLIDCYENINGLAKNTEVGHYQLSSLTKRFITKLLTVFDF